MGIENFLLFFADFDTLGWDFFIGWMLDFYSLILVRY